MTTFAFVMDPLERVQVDSDTTFAFMLAAQARGHQVLSLAQRDIYYHDGQVYGRGRLVKVQRAAQHFDVIKETSMNLGQCSAIFIRTDPPFDEHYLNASWLLSLVEAQGVKMVNSPKGLREANEHLYSLYWPQLIPQTYVGNDATAIVNFVEEVGGAAIAKPIDGHAGFGVVKLSLGDSNLPALVDLLTQEGQMQIMVQHFMPEGAEGDRRLLMVNGELRGVVKRLPKAGDNRANLHVGGTPVQTQISDEDQRIADTIGPRLKADGLIFVGADTIADKLIEINVTSPTLIQELHRLGGPDLASEVVLWCEDQ